MTKFAIKNSTAIMSARKKNDDDNSNDNNQTKQQREKEAKWKCAKLVKLKFASNLGRFDIFYATMRIRAANSLIVTTISAECFAASHLMCMIVDYMCIQHRTESVTLFHSFIPLFFLFSWLFCLLSLSTLSLSILFCLFWNTCVWDAYVCEWNVFVLQFFRLGFVNRASCIFFFYFRCDKILGHISQNKSNIVNLVEKSCVNGSIQL